MMALHSEGFGPAAISGRLNRAGIKTRKGGRWDKKTVKKIVARQLEDARHA